MYSNENIAILNEKLGISEPPEAKKISRIVQALFVILMIFLVFDINKNIISNVGIGVIMFSLIFYTLSTIFSGRLWVIGGHFSRGTKLIEGKLARILGLIIFSFLAYSFLSLGLFKLNMSVILSSIGGLILFVAIYFST